MLLISSDLLLRTPVVGNAPGVARAGAITPMTAMTAMASTQPAETNNFHRRGAENSEQARQRKTEVGFSLQSSAFSAPLRLCGEGFLLVWALFPV
jgi:hypothetical protein